MKNIIETIQTAVKVGEMTPETLQNVIVEEGLTDREAILQKALIKQLANIDANGELSQIIKVSVLTNHEGYIVIWEYDNGSFIGQKIEAPMGPYDTLPEAWQASTSTVAIELYLKAHGIKVNKDTINEERMRRMKLNSARHDAIDINRSYNAEKKKEEEPPKVAVTEKKPKRQRMRIWPPTKAMNKAAAAVDNAIKKSDESNEAKLRQTFLDKLQKTLKGKSQDQFSVKIVIRNLMLKNNWEVSREAVIEAYNAYNAYRAKNAENERLAQLYC